MRRSRSPAQTRHPPLAQDTRHPGPREAIDHRLSTDLAALSRSCPVPQRLNSEFGTRFPVFVCQHFEFQGVFGSVVFNCRLVLAAMVDGSMMDARGGRLEIRYPPPFAFVRPARVWARCPSLRSVQSVSPAGLGETVCSFGTVWGRRGRPKPLPA